jgi:hypothetical protein
MHVTSPCRGRRSSKRRSFAAVLMLAVAGTGGLAHGAGFDEKVKAPRMMSASQTYAQAKEFGARYREIRAATPSQVITNASLAREKFDLKWQVEHAIDERKPPENLAELGFESLGNGAYKANLNEHPEWGDLAAAMVDILTGPNLKPLAQALTQIGFRPEDVTTLTDYVATHDPHAASKAASLPVALGFAATVRKFDKAKRPVPDALVLGYVYQTSRAVGESHRLWAAELLKQFDAQRSRVLLSTFMEFPATGEWHPTDPALVVASQLNTVRLPNFDELAKAEAKGVAP